MHVSGELVITKTKLVTEMKRILDRKLNYFFETDNIESVAVSTVGLE